mgnify:FL=1
MAANIIFDLGNVLVDWDPVWDLQNLGLSPEGAKQVHQTLFASQIWLDRDAGLLSFEETMALTLPQLPAELHAMTRHFALHWPEHLRINEPVVQLARALLKAGHPLYLLSNASEPALEVAVRLPVLNEFAGLMYSFEEKLLKPDPRIFLRLFECYQLKPEESFFIDDSAANIAAAGKLGMPGHHFTGDLPALKAHMRAFGVQWEEA